MKRSLAELWDDECFRTTEEVAAEIGLSPWTIRRIRRGDVHRPKPDTIRRLADGLRLTPRTVKRAVNESRRRRLKDECQIDLDRFWEDDADEAAKAEA